MSESKPPPGWRPVDRESRMQRRRQLRRTAAELLTAYVGHVARALLSHGVTVTELHVEAEPDLTARLVLSPAEPFAGLPPAAVDLSWAEDTGWSLSHRLLGGSSVAIPWRYLHLELAPPPDVVARFAADVLADLDDIGMSYPAQFRFCGQPLQPVLDALARHAQHPEPL